MAESVSDQQRAVCRNYGTGFVPPAPDSKVGVALQTLGGLPIHGVRLPPTDTTCGWYIYAGEWSDADDFYQPLCIEHLADRWPAVLPFLGLPPGWRFLTDGHGSCDVWQEGESDASEAVGGT
jgi:hypothetical protein